MCYAQAKSKQIIGLSSRLSCTKQKLAGLKTRGLVGLREILIVYIVVSALKSYIK